MQDQVSVDLYIDGKWRPADAGGRIDLIDPAREEGLGSAAQATREDTLAAIDAAVQAFETWKRTPAWDRSKILRKAAMLLAERADMVARRLTLECGKPLKEAKGEVGAAVECIDWFADEARRIFGDVLPGRNAQQTFMTLYEPVGPVAAFTAWNFPVVLQARKIAPALAAGCSIVCRPAEEGTGAVAELIKCFIDAGVPAGVVNMLTGHPQEISETVMDSDLIRKVTFTGSIPVGQYFMRRAADTVKRMSMELGGHAPVIVHDDVDPEKVAKIVATGKFRNNGQVCVSPTRFYIHEKHSSAFNEAFVAATRALKIGHGLEPDTDVGPLINRRRLEAIEQFVADTEKGGAKLASGGRRPAGMNRGFFFEPTVFTDTPDDARTMVEEPFGPIASLTTFSEFDEVIARANSLPQGLAAYVFTNSLRQAHKTIEALKTGIVAVNNTAAATAEMPFGGVKHSGFGRENGRQGIMDYLDVKFANIVM
jgi:succinate-semialdehyde dehydrogenase/glutarate-semialdehyde dehydrogenase